MAIPLELAPPPAFERSVVPAFTLNFQRIRNALLHASTQTAFLNGLASGGWSQTINIAVPFRCDILLHTEITAYANAIGFGGTRMHWDGNILPIHADQFWNIANTHMSTTAINEIRRVEPGTHSLTQSFSSGSMVSDANDRLRWSAVFFEVF